MIPPRVVILLKEETDQVLPYLTASDINGNPFRLRFNRTDYDGIVEYSTDAENWYTYNNGEVTSSNDGILYLRGTGNTTFCNIDNMIGDSLSGTVLISEDVDGDVPGIEDAAVRIDGNIETLLDYQTVVAGNHPTMDDYAFNYFFAGSKVVKGPDLPATTLSDHCYEEMYYQSDLQEVPELPATTLTEFCYYRMFDSCTSLTTISMNLPATTLSYCSYTGMFNGCNSLTGTIHCPSYVASNNNRLGGNPTDYPNSVTVVFDLEGTPQQSEPSTNPTDLELPYVMITETSGTPFNMSFYRHHNEGTLEYSTDNENWSTYDIDGNDDMRSSNNGVLYLRGSNNTTFSDGDYPSDEQYSPFSLNTDNYDGTFRFDGNMEALLDYQTVLNGQHPQMGSYCFGMFFQQHSDIIAIPKLPATTLADHCYYSMLLECSALTEAPDLPATTLAEGCYTNMFGGCTSLTKAPDLPATTLAKDCYMYMFSGCTSLTGTIHCPASTASDPNRLGAGQYDLPANTATIAYDL